MQQPLNVSGLQTKETRDNDERDEENNITKDLEGINPKHYQLAEAGLWWDSFEEDPQFDVCDSFDDLTLNEGGKLGAPTPHLNIKNCFLFRIFI